MFDVSQTDVLPGAEQLALEPPHEPLTGDSRAELIDQHAKRIEAAIGEPPTLTAGSNVS